MFQLNPFLMVINGNTKIEYRKKVMMMVNMASYLYGIDMMDKQYVENIPYHYIDLFDPKYIQQTTSFSDLLFANKCYVSSFYANAQLTDTVPYNTPIKFSKDVIYEKLVRLQHAVQNDVVITDEVIKKVVFTFSTIGFVDDMNGITQTFPELVSIFKTFVYGEIHFGHTLNPLKTKYISNLPNPVGELTLKHY